MSPPKHVIYDPELTGGFFIKTDYLQPFFEAQHLRPMFGERGMNTYTRVWLAMLLQLCLDCWDGKSTPTIQLRETVRRCLKLPKSRRLNLILKRMQSQGILTLDTTTKPLTITLLVDIADKRILVEKKPHASPHGIYKRGTRVIVVGPFPPWAGTVEEKRGADYFIYGDGDDYCSSAPADHVYEFDKMKHLLPE